MANLITPEFIPGMREAQKRKSAVGTADLRGAKFPESDIVPLALTVLVYGCFPVMNHRVTRSAVPVGTCRWQQAKTTQK